MAQEYIFRLKNLYKKISNSSLIVNHNTDAQSLKHFENICNDSLPKNKDENEIKMAFRRLYLNNREAFIYCIKKTPYYIFFIDAKDICFHFNLQYVIYMKWDQSYTVTLFKKKSYN